MDIGEGFPFSGNLLKVIHRAEFSDLIFFITFF